MEHVDTGVDPVADKLDWLFDESVNDGRVGFRDHNTVVGWLGNLCDLERGSADSSQTKQARLADHDGSLATVGKVEITALVSLTPSQHDFVKV